MYGTKQGAYDWYTNIKQILLTLGYSVSIADKAIFYKLDGKKYTIIADLTKSSDLIKNQLNEHFEIVTLGDINWLLGINIKCNLENNTISLGDTAGESRLRSILGSMGVMAV